MTIFPKIFSVKIKPNSKKSEYCGIDDKGNHLVCIAEPAEDNKANIALIKFFKKNFGINIRIKSGLKNKIKIVEQIT